MEISLDRVEMVETLKNMSEEIYLINAVYRKTRRVGFNDADTYLALAYHALLELQEIRAKCIELEKMQPAPAVIVVSNQTQ